MCIRGWLLLQKEEEGSTRSTYRVFPNKMSGHRRVDEGETTECDEDRETYKRSDECKIVPRLVMVDRQMRPFHVLSAPQDAATPAHKGNQEERHKDRNDDTSDLRPDHPIDGHPVKEHEHCTRRQTAI